VICRSSVVQRFFLIVGAVPATSRLWRKNRNSDRIEFQQRHGSKSILRSYTPPPHPPRRISRIPAAAVSRIIRVFSANAPGVRPHQFAERPGNGRSARTISRVAILVWSELSFAVVQMERNAGGSPVRLLEFPSSHVPITRPCSSQIEARRERDDNVGRARYPVPRWRNFFFFPFPLSDFRGNRAENPVRRCPLA